MSSTEILQWAIALGLGAILAEIVRSFLQRKKMGADAAKTITEAATSLLGPLREELAAERAEHSLELKAERIKVAEVRKELDQALTEAKYLRGELAMARVEADALRRDREEYRAKDRDQQAEIISLKRRLAGR